MSFQTPQTIQKTVQGLGARRYVLPAIQREFVWRPEQIAGLFDSILKGYPIGSFLFWQVRRDKVGDFQFYEFLRDYHQRDRRHNPKASVDGTEDLTAVLDGQQRLTALYIGLCGTDARKRKHGRWDDPTAFPARRLYLNLLRTPGDDYGEDFDFRLLTPTEAAHTPTAHWFKVGDILQMSAPLDKQSYLIDHGLAQNREASAILFNLGDMVMTAPLINFYLEEAQDLHKVLTIFIRINSYGTPLNYADLLLSIATAQWQHRDARQEIAKLVDQLNQRGLSRGIQFDTKFILKACLVLAGISDVGFVVDNFKKPNVEQVESAWDDICKGLDLAVRLVIRLGFDSRSLTSKNALIAIAYYLLRRGLPNNYVDSVSFEDDRQTVNRWLITALLRGTFGGQADTVLSNVRTAITESDVTSGFPAAPIAERLANIGKNMKFNDEEIDRLAQITYSSKEGSLVLSLLYPNFDFANVWHKDHVFPQKLLSSKALSEAGVAEGDQWRWQMHRDALANLQLLEGTHNSEKSATLPRAWINRVCPTPQLKLAYAARHMLPDHNLDISGFLEFVALREQIMRDRLRAILGTASQTASPAS